MWGPMAWMLEDDAEEGFMSVLKSLPEFNWSSEGLKELLRLMY